MNCDEGRLVAFLNGQLSDEDEHALDEHLLTCDACWQAVRGDRIGRRALERLAVPAPPGLADRVTSSIRLADTSAGLGGRRASSHRPLRRGRGTVLRRPRRLVATVAVVVAVIGGVLGWVLQSRPTTDPPQIARVVAMMAPRVAHEAALVEGEQFDFGGQALTVRSYRVDDKTVLVATSARPFPVPASSHVIRGSSPAAWMAAEGHLAMYGVNRPVGGGEESMFLVAATPMAQLPQIAARLHLI